jgi:hypothetical protein
MKKIYALINSLLLFIEIHTLKKLLFFAEMLYEAKTLACTP